MKCTNMKKSSLKELHKLGAALVHICMHSESASSISYTIHNGGWDDYSQWQISVSNEKQCLFVPVDWTHLDDALK